MSVVEDCLPTRLIVREDLFCQLSEEGTDEGVVLNEEIRAKCRHRVRDKLILLLVVRVFCILGDHSDIAGDSKEISEERSSVSNLKEVML